MRYVLNPTNNPRYYGTSTVIPAHNYGVVSDEQADLLSKPVLVEGSSEFRPLFVSNDPGRTPNQIP